LADFVTRPQSYAENKNNGAHLPPLRVTRNALAPDGRDVMSRRITTAVSAAALTLVLATAIASGGGNAPGQKPPKNLTPPSVSGVAQVPDTLSSSTGTWQGKGLKYAYQWLRCDSAGASCGAISGATGSTKTLTTADVSYTLRVIVTATNRNGSAAAISAQTAVVTAASTPPPPPPPPPSSPVPPSNTALPGISGTAQQGQALNASTGSWSGSTPMTYTYQWQRCNTSGGACASIAGATAASYALATADVGSTMRVSVTASNSAGSATAASAATAVVTAIQSVGVIADEGRGVYGTSPEYMTNGDNYSAFVIGGYYSLFGSLPGRALKYANLNNVYDNNDVVSSIANARANGWLLHDANGNELLYQGSSRQVLVNPSNASFLSALRTRLLTFLAAHPFVDGIFFDNFVEDVRGGVGFGINYPVYTQSGQLLWSSPSDFQASELAAIQYLGNALKAAGYLVVVNGKGGIYQSSGNDNAVNATAWFDRYAPYISGMMAEYWIQNQFNHAVALSNHATWADYWNEWEAFADHVRDAGKVFWPASYSNAPELRQCRYLRASYLLSWSGSSGHIMFYPWSNSSDTWQSGCTDFDPDQPTGAKVQVQTGVWKRNFERGYVIINTTAASVTVNGVTIASGDAVLHQS
jgi:hypothetical protein